MNAAGLFTHKARLEENLWAAESLGSHGDDVAIRQLVGLLFVAAFAGGFHLAVEVQGDVAQLLLPGKHVCKN